MVVVTVNLASICRRLSPKDLRVECHIATLRMRSERTTHHLLDTLEFSDLTMRTNRLITLRLTA
jgi:hypothetical protein